MAVIHGPPFSSNPMERRQSESPGAARTRTDQRRGHTWIQALIQISADCLRCDNPRGMRASPRQIPALRRDFRAHSKSSVLQQNSLRNGTGNFLERTGNFLQRTGNFLVRIGNQIATLFRSAFGWLTTKISAADEVLRRDKGQPLDSHQGQCGNSLDFISAKAQTRVD
jgi:hypothetical protein